MPPPPSPPGDLEALIAALAEEARSRSGAEEEASPGPEELLDYLEGRLPPEAEERVARRLAADPDAARALLDMADLDAAGATAGDRPAELAARAGWRDFQAQLADAAPRSRRPPAWLPAAAASLLVATVGLGAWVWRLQGELGRPAGNLQSLELASGSRAGNDPVIELAPGAPLRLVLDPAERCPGYVAVLEGPRLGDRQTIENLERSEGGQVTVLLRRVEPGSYRLLLTGCEPRRELEEHRFRIAPR